MLKQREEKYWEEKYEKKLHKYIVRRNKERAKGKYWKKNRKRRNMEKRNNCGRNA